MYCNGLLLALCYTSQRRWLAALHGAARCGGVLMRRMLLFLFFLMHALVVANKHVVNVMLQCTLDAARLLWLHRLLL